MLLGSAALTVCYFLLNSGVESPGDSDMTWQPDSFNVLGFIWIGSVMVMGIKMLFDQFKLLKLVRKKIDPPYALVPGESQTDFSDREGFPGDDDPFGIKASGRYSKFMFTTFSDEELARQARKVRVDFLLAIAVGISGFIFIAIFIFLRNNSY
jgi:hypothetical protein